MHTSYLSLAVFAIGATAVPSFPKPNREPFAGSFPFFPSGSSSQSDEDSGLSNPVPAYMAAMQAVQSAQQGAYSTSQPTQASVPKHRPAAPAPAPAPAPQEEPSDDGMNNVAEETPMAAPSQPMIHATPTHAMVSSFVSMASPAPTLHTMHSMGDHEAYMSSSKASDTPSNSATPTPSPSHAPAGKTGLLGLAALVNSVPILGPLLSPLLGG